MKTNSLYIHIPFCQHLCSYCDFCKVYYDSIMVEKYLLRLQEELDALKINYCLKTIYIGGGTPSSLSLKQLQVLLDMIQPYINEETLEVCIEVNPESMNEDKMKVLQLGHINRLSIGVQTFNDQLVKAIERKHCYQEVVDVITLARQHGIDNLSIDLMYGLPNQTLDDIKQDLEIVSTLPLQHISYYSLILEDHTILKNQQYQPLTMEQEDDFNIYIDQRLEEMGFVKYEVSNYAKNGCISFHNKAYWQYDNYYGIGVGACAKIDNQMMEHTRNIKAYLEGKDTKKIEVLDIKEQVFTTIMMSLRLVEGVNIELVKQRYQVDILKEYQSVIEKYQRLQMLEVVNNRLRCAKKSMKFLNSILVDFM